MIAAASNVDTNKDRGEIQSIVKKAVKRQSVSDMTHRWSRLVRGRSTWSTVPDNLLLYKSLQPYTVVRELYFQSQTLKHMSRDRASTRLTSVCAV